MSDLEQLARKRVDRLFKDRRVAWRRPLLDVLRILEGRGWTAFLFGGTVRDLVIRGDVCPRDVDLVLDEVPDAELLETFQFCLKRLTRFGGLHLEHRGWLFDVWKASNTWGFIHYPLSTGRELFDLPRTTFLNVEAVVVEVTQAFEGGRRLFAHGFFEGIASKTVEINFQVNPYPSLCVVRSLVTAKKLGYRVGPRLACYIAEHGTSVAIDELVEAQQKHYGKVRMPAEELAFCISYLHDRVRVSRQRAISIPFPSSSQLALWHDDQWLDEGE